MDTEEPNSVERALTGGRCQFLLGFVLPEQARVWNSYLRGVIVRRRTECESALYSG